MRAGRQASPKTLPDFEILKVIEPKKCHPVRDRLLASGKVSSAKARGVFWKTLGYTKAKQRTAAITRLAASIRKGNPPAEKKGRRRQASSGRPGLAQIGPQMTHADRQTHRQQRQTDTDTARERQQNHTQTDRERPHGDRQTHRQTGTQKQTKTNRYRQRYTETQRHSQRDRDRHTQAETDTDRDRQRCCDKTTYAYACSHKPGCKTGHFTSRACVSTASRWSCRWEAKM